MAGGADGKTGTSMNPELHSDAEVADQIAAEDGKPPCDGGASG